MMKRVICAVFASSIMVSTAVVPTFANVLRTGSTGQPYAAESNTGSTQGIANRSATGTTSKITHDGFVPVVE